MTKPAHTKRLRNLHLTELCEADDPGAKKVEIHTKEGFLSYYIKPRLMPIVYSDPSIEDQLEPIVIEKFPLVIGADGLPWAEVNLWLASLRMNKPASGPTVSCVALDMAEYARFLGIKGIDWTDFPQNKLYRPTYRFSASLKAKSSENENFRKLAERIINTVIRFYRWSVKMAFLQPSFPPWEEFDKPLEYMTIYGLPIKTKVTTTDISLSRPKQINQYGSIYEDGRELIPLTQEEQKWLIEQLIEYGNPELLLICMFSLVTGARIQTVLTFRKKTVLNVKYSERQNTVRVPVGPGTGVDIKGDKFTVLHIPLWFFEKLKTYALSDRAQHRRQKADGGDVDNQYLFLSGRQCNPLYEAKTHKPGLKPNTIRYFRHGQGVRQLLSKEVINKIEMKIGKKFEFHFHNLRATFAMNFINDGMLLVAQGKDDIEQLLLRLQTRMHHAHLVMTQQYLNYKSRLEMAYLPQQGWEAVLQQLAEDGDGCQDD